MSGSRFATALANEIEARNKLIAIEKEQNIKSITQIGLMDGEISDLKAIIERKQDEINKLIEQSLAKDDEIVMLKKEIEFNRIERKSFKIQEDQNKELFLTFDQCRKERDELRAQLFATKNDLEQILLAKDSSKEEVLKKEVQRDIEIGNLKKQIEDLQINVNSVLADCDFYKRKCERLEKEKKLESEVKLDKIARLHLAQYQSLQRNDELNLELCKVQDDFEQLTQDYVVLCNQEDVIQKHLQKSLKLSTNSFETMTTVVDQAQQQCYEYSAEVRRLQKKNLELQESLAYTKKAIDILIVRSGRKPFFILPREEKPSVMQDVDVVPCVGIGIRGEGINAGRKVLFSRYLQRLVPESPSNSISLGLSSCAIQDEDIPNLIEWLRVYGCRKLELKNNYISKVGLHFLVLWCLSINVPFVSSSNALVIDLRQNRISKEGINSAFQELKDGFPGPNFFVASENDNQTLVVFQCCQQNGEPLSSLWIRIDCRENSLSAEKFNPQITSVFDDSILPCEG